jgi:RNA polymerase sigma-70 factor (ECF subfamily)
MEISEQEKSMRRWPGTRQPGAGGTETISLGDPELVIAARADRPAFAPLYERYRDDLLRYCHVCLGNWDDAVDAAHQVFANAFAGLPDFVDRGDSFRPWLFAIAHHEVGAIQRRRVRRAEDPLDNHEDLEDESRTPEALAIEADDHQRLRALLESLPDGQRRVVQLRLADLTDKEIAVILDMSEGAVRTAQCRAVGTLRDLMNASPAKKGGRSV